MAPPLPLLFCRCNEGRRGAEQPLFLTLCSKLVSLLPLSLLFLRSRSFHSVASLCASSSAGTRAGL